MAVDIDSIEKRWTEIASNQLKGRKIVDVRYLSRDEMESLGWHNRCIVMELDDGNLVFPSMDDEGNNAGALFTNSKEDNVLPVLS